RQQGCLALEVGKLEHAGAFVRLAREHLFDGAEPLNLAEAEVTGDVDRAHAPLATDPKDLVAPFEDGSGREGISVALRASDLGHDRNPFGDFCPWADPAASS